MQLCFIVKILYLRYRKLTPDCKLNGKVLQMTKDQTEAKTKLYNVPLKPHPIAKDGPFLCFDFILSFFKTFINVEVRP